MSDMWFAGDFCPRDATCSLEDGALHPINGLPIRSMVLNDPDGTIYTSTIQIFKDQESFLKTGTNPGDWIKCIGQLVPIANYTALFSLLGTIYGGDGRTTFCMPDLRNDDGKDYYIYTVSDIR